MKKLFSGLLVLSGALLYVSCEDSGPDTSLSTPSGLAVVSNTDSTVTLSWFDNSTAEDGFKIDRSTEEASGFANVGSVGPDITTYTDKGLKQSTTYYYRVYGYDSSDQSEFSATVTVKTGEKYYGNFNIQTVMTLDAGSDGNAEIVRMIPGSETQAVFVSSAINRLTIIDYTTTSFSFGATYDLDPGSATAEMTSLDVSPVMGDGENYVAVCVAEVDCAKGKILFVKLSDGTIVKEVEVGYNPDGTAFTKNGTHLIVACEDDLEDRPCKPADRHGGSVSIIDLTSGIENATLIQDYLVNWDEESEPEHAETSADGTVIVSVQETSQIMIFNVADVPLDASDITVVDLPKSSADEKAEPDGLFISPDGTLALISNERNGTFQMMTLPDGTLLGEPYIIEADIPAPPYNIDDRKSKKRTEPEECSLVTKSDKLYAVFALQESHGVIVYDVTDPANPVFDSIAPAGDLDAEDGDVGMENSKIGSEGLGMHQTNGVAFSANERQGSITMFTALWARDK
ncbi:MAG: fibronectin type III domain-containing protein [Candidatus Marinimicrobia bacterium]|nr:fibronectin type III domain-containing protein [Candidatus Neomarinimicrobiota bacterium]